MLTGIIRYIFYVCNCKAFLCWISITLNIICLQSDRNDKKDGDIAWIGLKHFTYIIMWYLITKLLTIFLTEWIQFNVNLVWHLEIRQWHQTPPVLIKPEILAFLHYISWKEKTCHLSTTKISIDFQFFWSDRFVSLLISPTFHLLHFKCVIWK